MTIDFVEDNPNKIDFVPGNNIDFTPDNSSTTLYGGIEKDVQASPYQSILDDKTLSQEQRIQRIKEQGQSELNEINRKHKIAMAKLYGGAALEIGSAAIPFGGAGRIGAKVALKVAKPAFSQVAKRVIAKNIGSGIGSGLASGAMFGAGQGLMEQKDLKGIAEETLKGSGYGAAGGALFGGVTGKLSASLGKTGKRIKSIEKPDVSHNEIEKTKENLLNLIHKRRSNIDLSKYDSSQKINNFISKSDELAKEFNVDSKKLREIMPFIRENTDLPASNFDRKDLIEIYSKLTPEARQKIRGLTDETFNDMEKFWNELVSVKDVKSKINPDEYITHIWDLSKEDQKIFSNYIRHKSQFEKCRVIPTYKEGIENGITVPYRNEAGKIVRKFIKLKPKTLDYAEIQKLHADQLIDTTENTRFSSFIEKMALSDGSSILSTNKPGKKYVGFSHPDLPQFKSIRSDFKNVLNPVYENPKKIEAASDNLARQLVSKAVNSYDMVNNFAKGCKFLLNGMHAVALTESSAAHSTNILPFKTIKTFTNLPKIIDGIKNNNYELFKNSKLAKEAIKDGVQFGAISDINIGEFNTFIDGFSKTLDKITLGASKRVTKPVRSAIDTNNKFLWNYLHNTYKLHSYDTLIKRVSKNGKSPVSDNVRRDIAQLVNDTFGGQNWDTLGVKPSTKQNASRILLAPDWNMSATIRQSLAVFSTESGQKFLNKFAQSSKFGSAVREFSRKIGISSFVNDVEGSGVRGEQARRYFMMFLAQTAIYSNGLNACTRAVDYIKDKEKYPDGIKNLSVYDNNRFTENYTPSEKVVNTLFPRPYIRQNEHGREIYARVGKQALEVPELVEDMPNSLIRKTASKTSPLLNPVVTKISDNITDGWNEASILERYKNTFTPYSLSSKDKFHPVNVFYSTTKGINAYQARAYLKECLKNDDMEAIEKFKPKLKANKIDFDRAMKRVKRELAEENRG